MKKNISTDKEVQVLAEHKGNKINIDVPFEVVMTRSKQIHLKFTDLDEQKQMLSPSKSMEELEIDYHFLANWILLELFENTNSPSITMSKPVADWIISHSQQKDEFYFNSPSLYYIPRYKNYLAGCVRRNNDNVSDELAHKANEGLVGIFKASSNKDTAGYIGLESFYFDACENGERWTLNNEFCELSIKPLNIEVNKHKGLLIHAMRKLMKNVRNSKEHKLKELYEDLLLRCDFGEVSLNKQDNYVEIFTTIPYRIRILDNDKCILAYKEDNYSKPSFVRNVPTESSFILRLIMSKEESQA